MEDRVPQMCGNLFDKNGNKIDVNIVATVYLSAFEISTYLKKCTNYSSADIKLVAKYINDLPGYDYSRKEVSYYKRKIEKCDWDFSTPAKKKEIPMEKGQTAVLLPGEEVIDTLKFSCVPLISWCILFSFAVYKASLMQMEDAWFFVPWVFAFPILYEIFRLTMNHVVLTNKRLIVRVLVPKKISVDIPINKINGVSVNRHGESIDMGHCKLILHRIVFCLQAQNHPAFLETPQFRLWRKTNPMPCGNRRKKLQKL